MAAFSRPPTAHRRPLRRLPIRRPEAQTPPPRHRPDCPLDRPTRAARAVCLPCESAGPTAPAMGPPHASSPSAPSTSVAGRRIRRASGDGCRALKKHAPSRRAPRLRRRDHLERRCDAALRPWPTWSALLQLGPAQSRAELDGHQDGIGRGRRASPDARRRGARGHVSDFRERRADPGAASRSCRGHRQPK